MMYIEIDKIQPVEVFKGFRAKFIHTEKMTIAFWDIDAGATIPIHQHVHEQTSQVLEGEFELTVDGERKVYGPGCVVIIPSNIPHGGVAITDCKLLDLFSPVREDYRLLSQ